MSDDGDKLQSILEEGRPLERISALEAGQERLSRDVTDLALQVGAAARETRQSFITLADKISVNQKTQWPVIISALALVVLIIGGLLSGYIRDLTKLESGVQRLESIHLKALETEVSRLQIKLDKSDGRGS